MNKKIFVISLENSIQRRENVSKLFKQFEIDFEFFNAIDGYKLDINDFKKKSILNLGEIGCLYSHKCVYQQIILESIQEAIIFEDDIYFDTKFIQFYRSWINSNIKNKFDLIKLGFASGSTFDYKNGISYNPFTSIRYNNLNIVRPSERSYGSFAYIITRECACELLNIIENNFKPIDIILQETPIYNINFFVLKKPICFPDFRFNSLIRDQHSFLELPKQNTVITKHSFFTKISIWIHIKLNHLIQFLTRNYKSHLM